MVDVLIVDDSAAIRKIVRRIIDHAHLPIGKAIEAADGREALEILTSQPVGVVLSDINMPNMDGLELLRQIKANDFWKKLPVVMVSSEGSDFKMAEALKLGAAGYIQKPFTPDQFKEKLHAFFNVKEAASLSPVDIVAAIKMATTRVFSTMLQMEIIAGELRTEKAGLPASGVVSLISLTGNWAGIGSLSCSADLACKLSSQFLTGEFTSVNEEVLDAIAEVTNMIIGNIKTMLETRVGNMGLGTPTVISGNNFATHSARVRAWTVVPFACADQHLEVRMCLAMNSRP